MTVIMTGDPFPGPFEFSEKNDYISVTAINIRGRKARVSQYIHIILLKICLNMS